ncbi:MAG: N-acetylmuramic acid 6-phosphate etherase [Flavobacteriaceae bacterium]
MAEFKKITETASLYDHLEQLSTKDLLENINREDQKVALAVKKVIPRISKLVDEIEKRFYDGGRLFYIGAGTSGRLGILDASEIPPTFGMPHDRVIGLIAGGDSAIRKAVEFAEDDTEQAWIDLQEFKIDIKDTLVGIAASGTTPYVLGGIRDARKNGILTAGITNNPGSPLAQTAEIPIEIEVGPEFVTGSTRMKSGTSQKLALNMITTSLMVRVGRVKGNKMVNMQLSNNKLVDRGTRYLMEGLELDYQEAQEVLHRYGSVRKALEALKK